MKHIRNLSTCIALACVGISALAQDAVSVGHGSYAAFPPTYKSRTDSHEGSWATKMETRQLYLNENTTLPDGTRRPIPTNDWWTDLINNQFANALWSLPQLLKPSESGVAVHYPSYWYDDGTEVKSRTSVTICAKSFVASAAIAEDWHDWDVEFSMPDTKSDGSIYVTMAHGVPFSWYEFTNLTPTIKFSATPTFYGIDGIEITSFADFSGDAIAVELNGDAYGLYLPDNVKVSFTDNTLTIENAPYISVALLPTVSDLARYAEWAYSIVRSTTVDWAYDANNARLTTSWSVNAVNLKDPTAPAPVLQGFLPHAYKHTESNDFNFSDIAYLSPRGSLKMATPRESNTFTYSMRFHGIMPHYSAPMDASFDYGRMWTLAEQYANEGSFGADTYWGGKGLIQMAMNMTFARELALLDIYEKSRTRLREALVNWLTYTQGEDDYFFAYYPRWGGLLGYEYSYDSDLFNDRHFHYGYFLYAGALLCMHDPSFKAGYGDMLRLLAKDFANWERSDSRFPFFRTLDPWVGHSYAGGLGDGANDNGNGQESSSEAMQGWGGVFLLGVALGDDAMRDAGIFGWLTESNAVAEYWFDRDHIYTDREHNYDYTKYTHPYNTNITSKGIGWWTWFSGDPLWMHSIQWMPVSPCLNYLSQDLNFVKWDYETFEQSTAYQWFESATRDGETLEPLANQSVGNVVLCYLERYNPTRAAEIFDTAWDGNWPIAKSTDTGHISYYLIHNHLTYGDPDYTVYATSPTANAYRKADGTMTYMVYNQTGKQQTVSFYRDGELLRTVEAASMPLINVYEEESAVSCVSFITPDGNYLMPGTTSAIKGTLVDQYAAVVGYADLSLDSGAPATLSAAGLTINQDAEIGTSFYLHATSGSMSAKTEIFVNEPAKPTDVTITPQLEYVEVGVPLDFQISAKDQYGYVYDTETAEWQILNGSEVVSEIPVYTPTSPGKYTATATVDGYSFSTTFIVTPKLSNLARNCTIYSSSEENASCHTPNANDGNLSTRWGSQHNDDEWIYVDLGKDCIITSVEINWEAAYASAYDIEIAPNGARATTEFIAHYDVGDTRLFIVDDWTTVKSVTGITSAGIDRQSVSATGRYLRIHGVSRGTSYGYSMYELAVNGIPCSTQPDDVIGIGVTVPTLINEGEEYTFEASAYTLAGDVTPIEATWTCDNSSGVFTGNVFRADTFGTMTVTATAADGSSASATTLVSESIKLNSIEASASSTSILLGDEVTISVTAYNQFGGLYSSYEPRFEIYEGENLTTNASYDPATGVFTASVPGTYRIDFIGAPSVCSLTINVQDVSQANLALGHPAWASTVHDNNVATNANDGDTSTRWESEWEDNQSITIDLEAPFVLNKMRLIWENAYATEYSVDLSLDGVNWVTIYTETAGAGGTEEFSFAETPAQYARVNFAKRATGYGSSLYELEIYGTERYTDTSGIENLTAQDALVDVYTLTGVRVRTQVDLAELNLSSGVYIVRSAARSYKILVK